MKAQGIFKALMNNSEVKLSTEKYKELQHSNPNLDSNSFLIYQMEQDSCNLYNIPSENIYYSIDFDYIIS